VKRLTFKGFLQQYVKKLSYCNNNDIRLLSREVPNNNYRLVEPLVLFSLSVNKSSFLNRVAEDSFLLAESFRFEGLSLINVESLLKEESENNLGSLPVNYVKVFQSYIYFRDKQKNQNHTKMLMHKRINELRLQKNFSVYRIYTDLKLNHGCVHAYIKNGNVSMVGLNTAKQILNYLEAA